MQTKDSLAPEDVYILSLIISSLRVYFYDIVLNITRIKEIKNVMTNVKLKQQQLNLSHHNSSHHTVQEAYTYKAETI